LQGREYKDIKYAWGPYWNKAIGRNTGVYIFNDGSREGTPYARLVMERNLGRFLTKDETVDHINRDKQ
jgi:hypothetical protein